MKTLDGNKDNGSRTPNNVKDLLVVDMPIHTIDPEWMLVRFIKVRALSQWFADALNAGVKNSVNPGSKRRPTAGIKQRLGALNLK